MLINIVEGMKIDATFAYESIQYSNRNISGTGYITRLDFFFKIRLSLKTKLIRHHNSQNRNQRQRVSLCFQDHRPVQQLMT